MSINLFFLLRMNSQMGFRINQNIIKKKTPANKSFDSLLTVRKAHNLIHFKLMGKTFKNVQLEKKSCERKHIITFATINCVSIESI